MPELWSGLPSLPTQEVGVLKEKKRPFWVSGEALGACSLMWKSGGISGSGKAERVG